MSNHYLEQRERLKIAEEVGPKVKKPRMYKVVLLNDDYTPMDFVVKVLEGFFFMPNSKAVQYMLTIHYEGKAICGIYTWEVAETKVFQVNDYARMHDHPLLCVMEPE